MNLSPALSLTCFQWPYIRRLFLFFSPPISVFISVLQNCSDLAFVFGYSVKLGQHVCRFSQAIAHLSCPASDASETYKIILFPCRYTRPF